MILELMKQEKILRSMRWLPIGLAMGAFLLALKETPPPGLPLFADDFTPQYLFFPALFFWAILVPYLMASGAAVRMSRYHMTLPIPSRDVWLSRVLAFVLSAWAALAIAAIVLGLGNLLQGKPLLESELASIMLNAAAFIAIGLMLTHIPGHDLSQLPLSRRNIAYLVLMWGGLLLVMSMWSALSTPWVLVPAAAAFALAGLMYRSLPAAFALAPTQLQRPVQGERQARHGVSRIVTAESSSQMARTGQKPSRWLLHGTIIRSLYNPVLTPALLAIILVFGLRNSGYETTGASNLIFVFWTVVCMSGILITGATRLHLLDPLPIRRQTIFAYLVLPGLLFAYMSYGLGAITGKAAVGRGALVEYAERYYDRNLDVRIPLEFWEISRNGNPAALEPCCDKPNAAWSVSFFKGSDLVLYNPYHAPADSSPEFVAHQFSRATEAVYGRQIPARELLDRYFERRPDGGTTLRTGRFNLLDDYPHLAPVGWAARLASVFAVIGLVWLIYLTSVLRLGHPHIMLGHVILTILGVVFLFTMIWTSNHGYTAEWKLSAGAGILVRHLTDSLPGSTLTLWALILVAIFGCYLLAEVQFRRMEIKVKPEPK